MKEENKDFIVPEPEQDGIDLSDLLTKGGEFLLSAVENQNDANIKIAEINKPHRTKELELQELTIKNQHESWVKATNAEINIIKREFTANALIMGGILLFLMACALLLLYKSEYQLALSIITLLIGFIGGYSVDKIGAKRSEKEQN